jgi:hypothetical protein
LTEQIPRSGCAGAFRRSAPEALVFLFLLTLAGCGNSRVRAAPSLSFTRVPPASEGSDNELDPIEGRASGTSAGQRIVLYARSGDWWVQPFADKPFTRVQADSTWKGQTHPGTHYAALLVAPGYHPRMRADELPGKGGPVLAEVMSEGATPKATQTKTVLFGGYEWQIRQTSSQAGGTPNNFDSSNAWTDKSGSLHLRIAGSPGHWTSAEVYLSRSLGYGSYRFLLRDVSHMEPASTLTLSTWDAVSTGANEMDIEISRWGEINNRNAQFVIQPYHIPANTIRFQAAPGEVTFMFRWTPGRAWFRAFHGDVSRWDSKSVIDHAFTSGVPASGNEAIHMNLYVFNNPTNPLQRGTEVIVEKFEYLP